MFYESEKYNLTDSNEECTHEKLLNLDTQTSFKIIYCSHLRKPNRVFFRINKLDKAFYVGSSYIKAVDLRFLKHIYTPYICVVKEDDLVASTTKSAILVNIPKKGIYRNNDKAFRIIVSSFFATLILSLLGYIIYRRLNVSFVSSIYRVKVLPIILFKYFYQCLKNIYVIRLKKATKILTVL